MDKLGEAATDYANRKFNALEKNKGLRNQIQNSPHYDDAMKAAREVLPKFENTYLGDLKEAFEDKSPFSARDLISVFGICGMSKVAGKALECLLGGVTFDRFLGILIEKTFDFMEMNTLSLFMNGLPADFREDLNAEIEKQFGGISLSDLFELKKTQGGDQKVKDVSSTRKISKDLLEIGVKVVNGQTLNSTEQNKVRDSVGSETALMMQEIKKYANPGEGSVRTAQADEDRKKIAIKAIKKKIRSKKREEILLGTARILNSLGNEATYQGLDDLVIFGSEKESDEELNRFEQSVKSFEETALGVKVDAVFDVVFDFAIEYVIESLSLDDLYARLTKYPVVDFVAGLVEKYFDSCPTAPIIYPPPGDFLKGLKLDICDPTISLTLPAINIPSINWKFLLETQFKEIFREAIIKIVSEIVIKILKKLLFTLESALCNTLEAQVDYSRCFEKWTR